MRRKNIMNIQHLAPFVGTLERNSVMDPANTRTKKNQQSKEGSSLHSLQQHLIPSAFMLRNIGSTLPSASAPISDHAIAPISVRVSGVEPQMVSMPRQDQASPIPAQSHIASSGRRRAPLVVQSAQEIITPCTAIDELLNRRELMAAARAACLNEHHRTEEATSGPQTVLVYGPPAPVDPSPRSVAPQLPTVTMAPSLSMISLEKVRELVAETVKEQRAE